VKKRLILILSVCLLLGGCGFLQSSQPNETEAPAANGGEPGGVNDRVPPTGENEPAQHPDEAESPGQRQPSAAGETSGQPSDEAAADDNASGNESFREVEVTKDGEDSYTVTGQARVFEGVVHYVVEDGHNELLTGQVLAKKGAPEWSDFAITFQVTKAEPNSTLIVYLFEKSAKDGSRRNELPIPLP